MSKKKRIFSFILLFIFLSLNKIDVFAKEELNYVKCGTARGIPKPVPQLTTIAYNFLIIGTPIILVAFSVVTLIKAIASTKEEEITKAKGKLVKKLIITAIIFLTSFVVQFAVNRVSQSATDKDTFAKCTSCFLYYSTRNCPVDEKGSGNDVTSNIVVPQDPNLNQGGSNITSNTRSSSTGDFTNDEIDKLALFTMSFEGGLDSNGVPLYNNFGECYALSSSEHSITIGAGGWMGQTGQKLLKRIRTNHPDVFNRLDTEGIGNDLDNADWGHYCIKKGSAKAKAIIAIITSDEGKKEQDIQIREDMVDYIKEANERFNLHDKKAIAMYMNVRHIFGPNNLQARLFNKITEPYTYEKIYNFIMTDPNFNYMDGYKNRYTACKKWIEENM
jgi:hypothetical protein